MSTHGLLAGHPPPSRDTLLQWLESEGVYVAPGLEVCEMEDGEGWRVVANRALGTDELVCQIPKTALLSARTSSLPPSVLPFTRPTTSHTIFHLALALLHELRLGSGSRWYGYLQSLPRRTVMLPLFWGIDELGGEDGKEARRWLVGTEAERDLARKDKEGLSLSDLAQFYNAVAAHLPSTKAHPEPSPLSAFLHAFSLITTRAFLIDLYHTVALVPFADLLNHSSEPHTSLASDDFVCHICGSLPRCTHDILDTEGGVMRLAHLPDSEVARLRSEADTVDMRADRAVEEGGEVFNSYGAMGDARLLVEWGFVAEDFAGEGLTWNPEDMGADEKVREMWVRILDRGRFLEAMLPVAQNGEAGHIESGVAEEDEDEDGLVGPPAGGRSGGLNLSQAGRISINLWVIALLVGLGETCANSSPEHIETSIIHSVREVNDRWATLPQEDDGSDEATFRQSPISPIGLQTARIIRNLLQTRLEGMHRADLAIDKLLDMRDSLSPENPLQRMAMALSVNERSLLQSALGRWDDLLSTLGPA